MGDTFRGGRTGEESETYFVRKKNQRRSFHWTKLAEKMWGTVAFLAGMLP